MTSATPVSFGSTHCNAEDFPMSSRPYKRKGNTILNVNLDLNSMIMIYFGVIIYVRTFRKRHDPTCDQDANSSTTKGTVHSTSHSVCVSQVRHTYWIPQYPYPVYDLQKHSTTRHFAFLQTMAEGARLSIHPFPIYGIGLFGPSYGKGGQAITKIWTCLFTCLAVPAVHLEYVKDLTSLSIKLTKTAIDHEFRQAVTSDDVLSYFATHGISGLS